MWWGITIISFLATGAIPESTIGQIITECTLPSDVGLSVEKLKTIFRHLYGLDQPIHIHYLRWMGVMKQEDGQYHGVFQGDLGYSIWEPRPY